MISEFYFGFHEPGLRNADRRIDVTCWMGHCEAWGYNDDGTWLFLDPKGAGSTVRLLHRHDDVLDALTFRHLHCASILRFSGRSDFILPLHGMMTCAAICGHLVGIRALTPWGLKRSLLAKGATSVHEKQSPDREPAGCGGETA